MAMQRRSHLVERAAERLRQSGALEGLIETYMKTCCLARSVFVERLLLARVKGVLLLNGEAWWDVCR